MKESLIDCILNMPIGFTTSKWVIEGIPFIFEGNLENYINWKQKLSDLINVDTKAIVLTGSASVGFSMNPLKSFKEFDITSDIDVAIISNIHFDMAWHTLRSLGTKYHRLTLKEKNAVQDHKERLIYHGTIATDKIVQLLPFGKNWVDAMNEMAKINPTQDRDINFRIYKDFEALKAYQMIGVSKVQFNLLKT